MIQIVCQGDVAARALYGKGLRVVTRRIDRTTQKVGDKYYIWYTERIWEATKDLPVIEVEIESLKHLDAVCWFDEDFPPTLRTVVEHFVRMDCLDSDDPLILDPDGQLFDGAHRVARALAQGNSKIKAVKMIEMPPPDEIVDSIYDSL